MAAAGSVGDGVTLKAIIVIDNFSNGFFFFQLKMNSQKFSTKIKTIQCRRQ
jgi:hypothetical protein